MYFNSSSIVTPNSPTRMSHTVFQTAQIITPMNSHVGAKTLSPIPILTSLHYRPRLLKVRAEVELDTDPSTSFLERCFAAPAALGSSSLSAPVMKGQYGAFGAATLEKSKLDLSQKQTRSSPEVCLFFFLPPFLLQPSLVFNYLSHFCVYSPISV